MEQIAAARQFESGDLNHLGHVRHRFQQTVGQFAGQGKDFAKQHPGIVDKLAAHEPPEGVFFRILLHGDLVERIDPGLHGAQKRVEVGRVAIGAGQPFQLLLAKHELLWGRQLLQQREEVVRLDAMGIVQNITLAALPAGLVAVLEREVIGKRAVAMCEPEPAQADLAV